MDRWISPADWWLFMDVDEPKLTRVTCRARKHAVTFYSCSTVHTRYARTPACSRTSCSFSAIYSILVVTPPFSLLLISSYSFLSALGLAIARTCCARTLRTHTGDAQP
jgi:hypothetical protein